MLAASRSAASEAGERLEQVQGLAEEVSRAARVKDELLQELAHVQTRQREVAAQLDASQDQLKQLETTARAIDQRRSDFAFTEKRIAAFEARGAELARMTEDVDARIAEIVRRDAVVEAVRKEVAGVCEVSARSKADLEYVEAHRNEIAALRERVDETLACARETETRLAHIEARKRLVDEVQTKTSVITNMLEDVRLNLETLGEQKAVVDHVMEIVDRLTARTQEAQTMLRSLQVEREIAERIERSIKQLRKGAPAEEKARLA